MKTVCFTSDNHAWLLRGFLHQWQKYGSNGHSGLINLEIAGFTDPGLGVPFTSIGRFEDYPVDKWSDAIIRYLTGVQDELVMIMLEDYWLMRPINLYAIMDGIDLMMSYPNVLRLDLTTDRMFSKEARYEGHYHGLDLCRAGGQYSLSFQTSIYRRKLLLEVMRRGETPWEAELRGSARVNEGHYEVLGSYQWPICYMIVMNKGQFDRSGSWMFPARTLSPDDWKELDNLGYTKEPLQVAGRSA